MMDDVHVLLNRMRKQLRSLEREMDLLQEKLGQPPPPSTLSPTFESLRGIWSEVVFGEEDFEASRLMPVIW